MKLLLKVAYNGAHYHGLVDQPHLNTVYHQLRRALSHINIHPAQIECSGRTDRGVSAANMVLSMHVDRDVKYDHVLNRLLPRDIRVKAYAYMHDTFSARYDCVCRVYRYVLSGDMHEYERVCDVLMDRLGRGVYGVRDFCTRSVERNHYRRLKKAEKDKCIDRHTDKYIDRDTDECTDQVDHYERHTDNNDRHTDEFIDQVDHYERLKKADRDKYIDKHTEIDKDRCTGQDDAFNMDYYANRSIRYVSFIPCNNVFYMEIASRSFLHNQIRRMMYFIEKNIGKSEVVYYDGIAEPYNLIFYEAVYECDIKWMRSGTVNVMEYEIEREKERMMFYQ